MVRHMRTTVRLNGPLLERARQEAARRGMTLTALIEQGLGLALRRPLKKSEKTIVVLPVSSATGGTNPGINLDSNAELLDRMDELR
jgi:hypothetical protein